MNSSGTGAEKDDQGEVWHAELLLQEETERASFPWFTKQMLKGTMKQDSGHLKRKINTWRSINTQMTGGNIMVNTHFKNMKKFLTVRGTSFRNSLPIKEIF